VFKIKKEYINNPIYLLFIVTISELSKNNNQEESSKPFSEDMKRIAADYFKLMIDKRDLEKEIELLKMENRSLKLKTGSLDEEIQKYVEGGDNNEEDGEEKGEKEK
jgi:hypothetical protein